MLFLIWLIHSMLRRRLFCYLISIIVRRICANSILSLEQTEDALQKAHTLLFVGPDVSEHHQSIHERVQRADDEQSHVSI